MYRRLSVAQYRYLSLTGLGNRELEPQTDAQGWIGSRRLAAMGASGVAQRQGLGDHPLAASSASCLLRRDQLPALEIEIFFYQGRTFRGR